MNAPTTAARPTARRLWLTTAVAAIAAGAGAGYAWRKLAGEPARPPSIDPAVQALWDQSFEQVDGRALRMATFRGQPLLLNFWATWCPPCVKEMPLLDLFQQRETTWQVLGLAIDQPATGQTISAAGAGRILDCTGRCRWRPAGPGARQQRRTAALYRRLRRRWQAGRSPPGCGRRAAVGALGSDHSLTLLILARLRQLLLTACKAHKLRHLLLRRDACENNNTQLQPLPTPSKNQIV